MCTFVTARRATYMEGLEVVCEGLPKEHVVFLEREIRQQAEI